MNATSKVSFELESRHDIGDTVHIWIDNMFRATKVNKINFEIDAGGRLTSYLTDLGSFYHHTNIILTDEEFSTLLTSIGFDCLIDGHDKPFKVVKVYKWHFIKIDIAILPVISDSLTFI